MTKSEIYKLCLAVKKDISPEYRAFLDDDIPGIQLTIGTDKDMNNWSFQTGDNSYSGGAYHYPIWAVVGVYKNSNCRELTNDIFNQIIEQTWS